MAIEVVMNAKELRKALAEIEIAEGNGFEHCDAVFRLVSVGRCIGEDRLEFHPPLITKGHPTDPSQDWGRYDYYKKYKFVDGKMVRLLVDDQ